MKEPIIYLDMDETLLNTIVLPHEDNTHIRTGKKIDGLWYYSCERPASKELISFCRTKATTKILTNATADYAMEFINEFWDFRRADVITRDEYLEEEITSGGYGFDRRTQYVINHRMEPNAILIDNLSYLDNTDKLKYLGIPPDRYIRIRDYLGGKDLCFDKELDIIKRKIDKLIMDTTWM